jgi:pentatricopeptide repeat protein
MAVARVLVRVGRQQDARELVGGLGGVTYRNDVRDALADALVRAGDLDAAREILRSMEEFDPWSLQEAEPQPHVAIASIANAYITRGELEAAAEVLAADQDLWAILDRRDVNRSLAGHVADLARQGGDKARATTLAFGQLGRARVGGRVEVLRVIGDLAPVLAVTNEHGPAECWARLRDVAWCAL